MFKPACSCGQGSWMCFRSCLMLNNYLRIPPWGWRLDSDEWQGVWDRIHRCLGQWSPPTFWNCTSEQVQNPKKLVKDLEKVFFHPGNSRKTQITCLGLTQAYWALFNIIQGAEKVSGSDGKRTGSVAIPALALQLNQRTNTCQHHSSQYTKWNIGSKSEVI